MKERISGPIRALGALHHSRRDTEDQLHAIAPLRPFFRFQNVQQLNQRVLLTTEWDGRGNRLFRVPFRFNVDGADGQTVRVIDVPDDWTFDYTLIDIDYTNKIGGRINGVNGAAAFKNYLIFGLYDKTRPPSNPFAGIIGMAENAMIYTAVGGSAAPGGIATLTFTGTGENNGNFVTVGARVSMFTNFVNPFNLGTVLARTNTSVTVQLDNNPDYSGNIPSPFGLMLQKDGHRPFDPVTGEPYGGFECSYLGSVVTGPTLNVAGWRKRFDPQLFANPILMVNLNASAGTVVKVDTSRFLPIGARLAYLKYRLTHQNGGGSATLQFVRDATGATFATSLPSSSNFPVVDQNTVMPLRTRDSAFYVNYGQIGPGTWTIQVYLNGYEADEW